MNPTAVHLDEDRIVSLEDYLEAFVIYKKFLSELTEKEVEEADRSPQVQSAKKKFDQIRGLFTRENGQILNRYICGYSNSAVVLCEKKGKGPFARDTVRFFSQYELGNSPEIESLLIEIDFLAAESTRLLRGKSLRRCLLLIFKVAKNTLVLLDSVNQSQGVQYNQAGNMAYMNLLGADIEGMPKIRSRSPDNGDGDAAIAGKQQQEKLNATIKVVQKNLKNARDYHNKAARLTAQMDYFVGNIWGFLLILATLITTGWATGFSLADLESTLGSTTPPDLKVAPLLFFGIASGCVGAIMSVMNRLSTGDMQLNHEPASTTIRVIGLIRPFIGGVFGGLLLLLLNSGLSIFSMVDENPSKVIANFIVLGFIAGFFERFVPDILEQTKGKIAADQETDEPAPAADPAPKPDSNPEPA